MNKKTYFEAPSAELIVVRFEESFLLVSNNNYGTKGAAGDVEEGYEYEL